MLGQVVLGAFVNAPLEHKRQHGRYFLPLPLSKNFLKIFKKSIDKSPNCHYNIKSVRETRTICTISSVGRAPDS